MKVKCQDGSERIVLKNPDDAFPLAHKKLLAKIHTEVKALAQLQVDADADVRELIAGFLFQIDEINSSLIIHLRSAYVVFSTNPCEMDKWLAKEVEKIIKEETKMRNTLNKLRLKISRGQEIKDAVSKAMAELASDKKADVSEEITKIRKETKKWQEGAT